ncbi:MAG TPA: PhzF family phenazine biosynthesis protein [Acidobacteriota bacterium]|nr:PhzF family phenazine biosynthesis protein [Acidobacteriota bacterium]HRV08949.1 PhzF family phenazine biosynthesis protein [Acidobacteriota bacterium]
MSRFLMFQVDAFTTKRFAGNPAAVVLLGERQLPDGLMQAIAAENNLSETAFVGGPEPSEEGGQTFHLRWFTPACEVDLCGHATLAAAHVLFSRRLFLGEAVVFRSRSGPLQVSRSDRGYAMDFPARPPAECAISEELIAALGARPVAAGQARDLLAVFDDPETVASLEPDFEALKRLETFAVIVTAPGEDCDFVSRFFGPRVGVNEDPVTGSAHCTLAPYWAERLGRNSLHARQLSSRGGELWCEVRGDRVVVIGQAVDYLEGTILV